jgi:hypothetical protein
LRPFSLSSLDRALSKLVEQRLSLLQIGHAEPLGEPAVDWREERVCLSALTFVAAMPGEAGGGAQFEKSGSLVRIPMMSPTDSEIMSLGIPG